MDYIQLDTFLQYPGNTSSPSNIINMASLLVVVLSCFVAGVLWLVVKHWTSITRIIQARKAAAQFHYDPPHWLLGNFDQVKDFVSFRTMYDELTKKFSRMFIFWAGPLRPVLTVVHPDTAREILKSSQPKITDMAGGYRLVDDWIGDGLLLSWGAKWERNRKLLTPAFHFAILKLYEERTNSEIKIFLEKIENERKKSEYVEVYGPVGLLTLAILLQCAFSKDAQIQQQGESHPYVVATHDLATLVVERGKNPILRFNWIYHMTANARLWKKNCDYVHKFAQDIIDARRKTHTEGNFDVSEGHHLDFLDILLRAKDEEGVGLSDTEIRDEVDTFLFAGHDTTASAGSWALYALAKYPDEQEKVYTEVCDVIGDRHEIQWDDLSKLQQTKTFLKEVLRFFSPVYQISRQLTTPFEIDGHKVPKGMCVDINIMNINHNQAVWENPDVFDSSRFERDEFVERDPFMFVPFSAGPRNCIGQNFAMNELKTLIALTLQRYRLEVDPAHLYTPMPCVVMRAQHGIKLKFVPRTAAEA